MAETSVVFFTSQLATQAPILIVYLVSAVVSLVFLRRAPLASALALIGAVILMAAALALPLIQAVTIHQGGTKFRALMGFIGLASSCVRAAGTSLLVCAIFVGRSRPTAGSASR